MATNINLDFLTRHAHTEDAEEILEIQSLYSFLHQDDQHLEKDGKLENIFSKDEIKELCKKSFIMVATVNEDYPVREKIIGYIMVQYSKVLSDRNTDLFFRKEIEKNSAMILQICVLKEYRMQGVGKALLKEARKRGEKFSTRRLIGFAIDVNNAIKNFMKDYKRTNVSEHFMNPNKKLVRYIIDFA